MNSHYSKKSKTAASASAAAADAAAAAPARSASAALPAAHAVAALYEDAKLEYLGAADLKDTKVNELGAKCLDKFVKVGAMHEGMCEP